MTQCSALTNALNAKGYNSATLAARAGLQQQRVDAILAGNAKPTQQEFDAIARALELDPSSKPQHAAQVVVV